jgi:hypothetical protein
MEGSCLQWLFGILCMTCFLELPTWQVLLMCFFSLILQTCLIQFLGSHLNMN